MQRSRVIDDIERTANQMTGIILIVDYPGLSESRFDHHLTGKIFRTNKTRLRDIAVGGGSR